MAAPHETALESRTPDSAPTDTAVETPAPPVSPLVPGSPKTGVVRGGGGGDDDDPGRGRGDGGREGPAFHESGPPIPTAKFAMYVFLGSLVMLFSGFLAAYTVLRHGVASWPPPGVPPLPSALWISTAIIVASSATFQMGFVALRSGRLAGLRIGLVLTTLLGLAFVASQVLIWQSMHAQGIELSSHTYGAIFYTLTGLHAVHVLGGILSLLVVSTKAMLGRYGPRNVLGVELCGMYWHFVGLVWIALFTILYLVG